jgi:hypothetical protein
MAWTAPRTWVTGELVTAAMGNAHWRDNLVALQTAAKELWTPVNQTSVAAITSPFGTYSAAALIAANDMATCTFKVPADFLAIVEAKVVVRPVGTDAAANWDIYVSYAAIGQAYGTHTANNTATTYNVTADQFYGVDISALLANLAGGDIVGVGFVLMDNADDVSVLGTYLKYTVTTV